MTIPDAPPAPPPRSWLQFSLRGLLLLTALVALFFGWREWRCWPARRQAAAIAAIRAANGEVKTSYPFSDPFGEPVPDPFAKPVDPFAEPPPISRTLTWEEAWLGIPQPLIIHKVAIPHPDAGSLRTLILLDPPEVAISSAELSSETIARLTELSQLTSLTISDCGLTPDILGELRQLPTLTSLYFVYTASEPEAKLDLRLLRQLPALEWLSIEHHWLRDEAVGALSGCRALKKVNLQGCRQLTARCLDGLTDLPKLQDIFLPGGVEFDGESLVALSRFPLLNAQRGCLSRQGEDSCDYVYQPSVLHVMSPYLMQREVQMIAACPQLEALVIEGAVMSDATWDAVASLSELPRLRLRNVDCRDDLLLRLAEMPHLELLDVELVRDYWPDEVEVARRPAYNEYLTLLESADLPAGRRYHFIWQSGIMPEGLLDLASRFPRWEAEFEGQRLVMKKRELLHRTFFD